MDIYADYEAIELDVNDAEKHGIFPYYLRKDVAQTAVCPIFFSACTAKGSIINKQNCLKTKISFIELLNKVSGYSDRDITIWFHYLPYDFHIIIHELFYNKFVHIFNTDNMEYEGYERIYADNYFTILGENLNRFIGVDVFINGRKIMLRDTFRIITSSQDKILKDFGFKPKVAVDWNMIKTGQDIRDNIALIEERNIYDIESLAKSLEMFKNTIYDKYKGKGVTAGAISNSAYQYFLCQRKGMEKISNRDMKETYREYYPIQTGIAAKLNTACYSGGICQYNYRKLDKIYYNLQCVDENSAYPMAMCYPLPYGDSVAISDFCEEGYSEYVVYISFEHKGIPFLRCNSENRARDIIGKELLSKEYTFSKSDFPQKFTGYLAINSIDLEVLKEYANIHILEFKTGINYETSTMTKEFIEKLYEEKRNSEGAIKAAAKLLQNSLYGKQAQDLSGPAYLYTSPTEYVKYRCVDNNPYYKPFSSAVTAYARKFWVDTMKLIESDFIYGDTDSLYFENPEKCLKILKRHKKLHKDNLGKWAIEYENGIGKGKFLSKKNYILEVEGKTKITCVGLSHKYHHLYDFDTFYLNSPEIPIQKICNVYGGKSNKTTKFTIKERNTGRF